MILFWHIARKLWFQRELCGTKGFFCPGIVLFFKGVNALCSQNSKKLPFRSVFFCTTTENFYSLRSQGIFSTLSTSASVPLHAFVIIVISSNIFHKRFLFILQKYHISRYFPSVLQFLLHNRAVSLRKSRDGSFLPIRGYFFAVYKKASRGSGNFRGLSSQLFILFIHRSASAVSQCRNGWADGDSL